VADPGTKPAPPAEQPRRPLAILLHDLTLAPPTEATTTDVLARVGAGDQILLPRAAAEALGHASAPVPALTVLDEVDGFAALANAAMAASGTADLVFLSGTGRLVADWADRLRAAAHGDDTVAAATALVARGDRLPAWPGDPALRHSRSRGGRASDDAVRVRPVRPRMFALWPECALIRREAVELLGPFDESLATAPAVLLEFAMRAAEHGLSCVLADDVWMDQASGAPGHDPSIAAAGPDWPPELRAVDDAHPWRHAAEADTAGIDGTPLRRAIVAAQAARDRPSVTIDARAMAGGFGGTQTYIGAMVAALARADRVSVRAVVTDDTREDTLDTFRRAGIELITYEDAVAGAPRTDIIHRPHQVFTPADLRLLRMLGERIVITHLDLIAYRSPAYHATADEWLSYRRTTRLALACADRVVFFSDHARRDALAEDLISPFRSAVAGIGIEPAAEAGVTQRPPAIPEDREFILMLGADYAHKNRPFAIKLVDALRTRHDWNGLLVLAGRHVPHGSSAAEESRLLAARPDLAEQVVDLGSVTEAERRWLTRRAQAQLSPSAYEGFGLTPLEAAAAGCPCIYAPCTSLAEVVGTEAATVVPWSPEASADAAIALLRPGAERTAHLSALRQALEVHSWEGVTSGLHEIYEATLASPYRGAAPHTWEEIKREEYLVDLHGRYQDLLARVAEGLPLIDRDGLLTRSQQRGLMRIASRPWLRAPLLGPVGWLGRRGRTGV
jgi:glycosyltransferase involved in cell wall biosynthesis